MPKTRTVQYLLWAAIIVSPLLSMLIVGLVSGTTPWAIDAWNTLWNDEQTYYTAVSQMHFYGEPTGISGYNEVMSERLGYGPYTPVVFLPFYLPSLITGLDGHNCLYLINFMFGLVAAALIVVIARPNVRESVLCIVLIVFQVVISRYVLSGMSEASYLILAVILGCGGAWAVRRYEKRADAGASEGQGLLVALIVIMVLALCFWGMMRPYLLALILIPIALIVAKGCPLRKPARIALFGLAVVVSLVSLAGFMYFGKYYVAPFFGGSSISNSLFGLLADGLGNLVGIHVDAIKTIGKSFLKLQRAGVMTAWFTLECVVLLVMAVRAWRQGKKATFLVLLAALLAGFAQMEAIVFLYNPIQLNRSLTVTELAYALLIILLYLPNSEQKRPVVPAVLTGAASLMFLASLVASPYSYAFPQEDSVDTIAVEDAARAELTQLMPKADDLWGNTIAHPVENASFQMYFCLPVYITPNCCERPFLKKALTDGTLKSKYLSMPDDYELNDLAKSKYPVIYQGFGHIIYLIH